MEDMVDGWFAIAAPNTDFRTRRTREEREEHQLKSGFFAPFA
jgi:hypothetical protein